MKNQISGLKKIVSISALALALSACDSGDVPTEYVFDRQSLHENPKKYVAGSTTPEDRAVFSCVVTSELLLMKETLKGLSAGKKIGELDAAKTPTRIKVYENKIEWVDLGKSTPIEDKKTILPITDDNNMTLYIERRDGSFSFGFKEKGTVCEFPLKKVEG